MTVSTTSNRISYNGDASSTVFSFPYKFLETSDLQVYVDGELQVITTDYAVGTPSDTGANVTLVSAPAAGTENVIILRNPNLLQQSALPSNGPFPAPTVERMVDKSMLLIQRLSELFTRSFRLADTDTSGADTTLPSPESNSVIGWNETATALQNFDPQTFATIVAFGTANSDVFSGDGVTTDFTLTDNPGALNNLDISIGGVTQTPGADYVWTTGTTLSFTTAPPLGTDNILVRYMQGLPIAEVESGAWTQNGTGSVQRTVGEKLREIKSTSDFGVIGDGVTDDTAAWQLAANWLKGADYRKLTTEGGQRYKITSNVSFSAVGREGCSLEMNSPITPDAGINRAFTISGYRHSEFKLRVDGGGQDADYTQADPVNCDQAFYVVACRRCKFDIIGTEYAGRVLRVRAAVAPYKTSFLDIHLTTGDLTAVAGATKVGQACYVDGTISITAFGGFRYLNSAWCKYSPYFKDVVDLVIEHAEGGTGSNLSSWTFDNCGSVWLGDVLMGDETNTETLMHFKNGCRRISIGNFFAVMSAVGLLIEDTNSSLLNVHINSIHGTGNLTLVKLNNVYGAKINCINSNGDENALIVSGASRDVWAFLQAVSNKKESVIIEGTANSITISGTSRDASQLATDTYANAKVTSTQADIVFDDFNCFGSSTLSAFDLVASNNVRIYKGRYTSAPLFNGSVEPIQIRDTQGIRSEAQGSATILSGNTTIVVAHGVFNIPSYVFLTGTNTEVKECWVTSVDATNFTINVPAAVTANRIVHWYAARRGISTS